MCAYIIIYNLYLVYSMIYNLDVNNIKLDITALCVHVCISVREETSTR